MYLSKVAVMHFTVLSCCFTIPVYDNDKYLWNISQPAASVLHFITMLHSGTPLSCAKYFISYGKNSCTSEQICWQRKSIVFLVLVFFVVFFFYLSLSLTCYYISYQYHSHFVLLERWSQKLHHYNVAAPFFILSPVKKSSADIISMLKNHL